MAFYSISILIHDQELLPVLFVYYKILISYIYFLNIYASVFTHLTSYNISNGREKLSVQRTQERFPV